MTRLVALRVQQLRRELPGRRIDAAGGAARLLRSRRARVPTRRDAVRADALLVLPLPCLARPRTRQRRAARGRVQVPHARGCVHRFLSRLSD